LDHSEFVSFFAKKSELSREPSQKCGMIGRLLKEHIHDNRFRLPPILTEGDFFYLGKDYFINPQMKKSKR